jgi:hypothetical protein
MATEKVTSVGEIEEEGESRKREGGAAEICNMTAHNPHRDLSPVLIRALTSAITVHESRRSKSLVRGVGGRERQDPGS